MTHFIPGPIGGRARPEFARYPSAVCSTCAAQPRSADGRPLLFENQALFGGLTGRYADTGEPHALDECSIGGVLWRAEEAWFGGVVIQVAPDDGGEPHTT